MGEPGPNKRPSMRSEKEKLLGGELYDPLAPQLSAERRHARLLCKALNDTRDDQQEERAPHQRTDSRVRRRVD
jgi:hypothetical protein